MTLNKIPPLASFAPLRELILLNQDITPSPPSRQVRKNSHNNSSPSLASFAPLRLCVSKFFYFKTSRQARQAAKR